MAISITKRVRNAMVGLCVVLCLLFTGLIFLLVYIIEDQVFINQLKAEQASFEQAIAAAEPQNISDWKPANANIQLVSSADELPLALLANSSNRVIEQAGVHEYFDDHNAMFIAHIVLPETDASYYLVYDVKNLLAVRGTKLKLFAMIAGLTLLITCIAVLLARRLTKSTLEPISRLSRALQNDDLDHVIIEMANQFSEDEVGILMRELALALERVRTLAEREYEFNRGVSHELRSPIQVAQSATELLQLYTEKNHAENSHAQLRKPVSRLKRSIAEMNEVAEAFLWLASERTLKRNEMCSVDTLKNTLTSLTSTLTSTRPSHDLLSVIEPKDSFCYPLPSAVLSMIVRSLVRNASVHGESSQIIIEMTTSSITVTNTINSLTQVNVGFGVGLTIVQRICARFDCELKTGTQNSQTFLSSIEFAKNT